MKIDELRKLWLENGRIRTYGCREDFLGLIDLRTHLDDKIQRVWMITTTAVELPVIEGAMVEFDLVPHQLDAAKSIVFQYERNGHLSVECVTLL